MAVTQDHAGGANNNEFDNDLKTSMRRAVIERLKEELRKERILLQERKRELEFLQKNLNPLDFQYWNEYVKLRSL